MFDSIDRAIYSTIHDFDGGASSLAPLINRWLPPAAKIKAGTLSNKANPRMAEHKLTIHEAVAIQGTTQRFDILFAKAMTLNHACIPLGDFSGCSDVELLGAYTAYHQVDRVRKEFFEDVQAGLAFIARLEGLVDV